MIFRGCSLTSVKIQVAVNVIGVGLGVVVEVGLEEGRLPDWQGIGIGVDVGITVDDMIVSIIERDGQIHPFDLVRATVVNLTDGAEVGGIVDKAEILEMDIVGITAELDGFILDGVERWWPPIFSNPEIPADAISNIEGHTVVAHGVVERNQLPLVVVESKGGINPTNWGIGVVEELAIVCDVTTVLRGITVRADDDVEAGRWNVVDDREVGGGGDEETGPGGPPVVYPATGDR